VTLVRFEVSTAVTMMIVTAVETSNLTRCYSVWTQEWRGKYYDIKGMK
jgi:hypothetical protein